MGSILEAIVTHLNGFPPEFVSLLMMLAAFGGALALLRLFGAWGLTAFVLIGVVGANIQVLKVVQFNVFPNPVALGTVLFTTTYLATDMLTEYYGPQTARRAIWLGFWILLLHNLFMLLTLGYRPLEAGGVGEEYAWALPNHGAMTTLFLPQPGLLLAGLTAYLISQHLDVAAFQWLRRRTHSKALWVRNLGSTLLSTFIDNVVFSVLAWVVFAPTPMPWQPLVFTYILGTYTARLIVALLNAPVMYLSRSFLPAEDRARYAELGADAARAGA
jgi:uncharacterized integral membrane protein (TIGR00697 family)